MDGLWYPLDFPCQHEKENKMDEDIVVEVASWDCDDGLVVVLPESEGDWRFIEIPVPN